jgi:hypothetical protein
MKRKKRKTTQSKNNTLKFQLKKTKNNLKRFGVVLFQELPRSLVKFLSTLSSNSA